MKHTIIIWTAYTIAALFAIVYKAVMASGSELHAFSTTLGYFKAKPITTVNRFALGQIGFAVITSNPSWVGNALTGSALDGVKVGPIVLALLVGLSSDKVADIILTAGEFIFKKITAALGGNSNTPGQS
jgi:hypothetical protein